ncbi:MAG TPA: DUF1559 domain-containing protein, partial [Gemmataceae bacterium]
RRYDDTKLNRDPANEAVRISFVPVYTCPSDQNNGQIGLPWTRPANGASNTTDRYMNGSYRGMGGKCHKSDPTKPDYDPGNTDVWGGYYETEYLPNFRDKPGWRGPLQTAPVTLPGIADGTSTTLLVGERTVRPSQTPEFNRRGTFWADSFNLYSLSAAWGESATLLDDYDTCFKVERAICGSCDNRCKYGWGSPHLGQINFVFCDGSVRSLSQGIDMAVFQAMATVAGGPPPAEPIVSGF